MSAYVAEAQLSALAGSEFQLPAEAFVSSWREAFTLAELADNVLPERTLSRRLAKREPLTATETDRALRIARVAIEAERVFGAADKAARWLRKPNAALEGQTPLTMLRSEIGARAVEETLIRIDHGIFA